MQKAGSEINQTAKVAKIKGHYQKEIIFRLWQKAWKKTKQMVSDCKTSLSFLGHHNFVATKVKIFNENTHEYETITLVHEENIQTSSQTESL